MTKWQWVHYTVRPHPAYYPANLPDGTILRDGSTVGLKQHHYVPGNTKEEAVRLAINIAEKGFGILAENPKLGYQRRPA